MKRTFVLRSAHFTFATLVLILSCGMSEAVAQSAPQITSLNPASGVPGTQVTIAGSSFNASPGGVTFNGLAASISSWSSTSIVAIVPNGATTGNVVVSSGGLQSNGVVFSVPPVITGITPAGGIAGTAVTISGVRFGSVTGTVSFHGTSATVTSWTDTSIAASVPNGAATGNVVVTTTQGDVSNGMGFLVSAQAFIGPVTYSYDELGRLVGAVAVTGDAVKYTYDAVGNITAITRYAAGQVVLTSFSPNSGPAGIQVSIAGSNFSPDPTQDTVTFNGTAATIVSASSMQLLVTVPSGATSGPVTVTAPAGSATSGESFTVKNDAPRIDSFTPQIVVPGGSVAVTGGNFDLNAQNDRLAVNLTAATTTGAVTATNITLTTPVTGSGHISLATPTGVAVSAADLYVPPAPYTAAQVSYAARSSVGGTPTVSISTPGIGLLLFDGIVNHSVSVSVSATTFSSGCVFQLYRPDGTAMGPTASCAALSFLDAQTLPVTGTYTLLAVPASGNTGNATLLLSDSTDLPGTITPNGPAVTVSTAVPGQNVRLAFKAAANQLLTVLMDNNTYPVDPASGTRVTLQIISPTGAAINTIAPSTANGFMDDVMYCINTAFGAVVTFPCAPNVTPDYHFRSPAAGTYTLLVNPATTGAGQVRVQLFAFDSDVSVATTLGNSTAPAIPVSVARPGQNALISFPVDPNTQKQMSMTFTNSNLASLSGEYSAGFTLVVLDPTGHPIGPVLGTEYSFTAATTSGMVLFSGFPTSGTYTLVADPINDTTGSLNLNVYDATDLNFSVAADGASHTIFTNAPGQHAYANFPVTQGQRIFGVVSNITGYTYTSPGQLIHFLEQPGYVFYPFQTGSKMFISSSDYGPLAMPGSGTNSVEILPAGTDVGSATVTLYTVPADISGTIDTVNDPVAVATAVGQKANLAFPFSTSGSGHIRVTMTNGSYPAGTCRLTVLENGQPWSSTVDCSGASNSWLFQLYGPNSYSLWIDPQLDGAGGATFAVQVQP